ncbi:MAG: hypothetical protein ACL7BU_10340 [Candidatus Phlomobacter fragariae]
MNTVPNHVTVRELRITNSTVYTHKKHITKKIFVDNRIEFSLFIIFSNIFIRMI